MGKKMGAVETRVKCERDAVFRRQLFKELLQHIEKGFSLDCFPGLSKITILKYLETYKDEFIQEELDCSMRRGKIGWEEIGSRQAKGTCLGNSRSWYYNMANRYNWTDKQFVETEHKGAVSVNIVSYASSKGIDSA